MTKQFFTPKDRADLAYWLGYTVGSLSRYREGDLPDNDLTWEQEFARILIALTPYIDTLMAVLNASWDAENSPELTEPPSFPRSNP